MDVRAINPFLEAAIEVLHAETGFDLERKGLTLDHQPYQTEDVTILLAMVGMVSGTIFYAFPFETAYALVSQMMGEEVSELDHLGQSALAELANVITGKASVKLSQQGYDTSISPPTLLVGREALISTLDFPRLVVSMSGACGPLSIHLALREGQARIGGPVETPPSIVLDMSK
jgi:chemotaxis protein CheX